MYSTLAAERRALFVDSLAVVRAARGRAHVVRAWRAARATRPHRSCARDRESDYTFCGWMVLALLHHSHASESRPQQKQLVHESSWRRQSQISEWIFEPFYILSFIYIQAISFCSVIGIQRGVH